MKLTVTQIHIYPVKSLAGISLTQSKVERRGLQYDRRWMLINGQNRFLSQRDFPEMALLQPAIADGHMTLSHKHKNIAPITFPLDQHSADRFAVTIWGDTCAAAEVSTEVSAWFSEVLGAPCRLVYMPDESVRLVEPELAIARGDHVSFADGYPILMFDEASVALITEKAGEEIPENRFRGNIIFKGGHAHIEDEISVFEINGDTYHGIKPCTRCIMTTIDQQRATGGSEPLKSLASYRKVNNKIKFGQNVIPPVSGTIALGDTITVKEMTEPVTFSHS
jgi:uncharacterized protein YcbX